MRLGQPVAPRTLGRWVDMLSTAFEEGPSHAVMRCEGCGGGCWDSLREARSWGAAAGYGLTPGIRGAKALSGCSEAKAGSGAIHASRQRRKPPVAVALTPEQPLSARRRS